MVKNKGPKKGFAFERKISKLLSLWWTNIKNDAVFWKTEGSGGRATVREKKGKKTKYSYGDITFKEPIGQLLIDFFLIECKKGYSKGKNRSKKISILDLVDSRKKIPLIIEWWIRAEKDRSVAGRKRSLIIFERDNKKACVIIHQDFFILLMDYCGSYKGPCIDIDYTYKNDLFELTIISLEGFFDWVSSETIRLIAE